MSDRLARQFGDRTEGTLMPIDPSMLAKSIGILTDLDPQRDLAKALQDVVVAAKQLFDVDAAGVMLADADGQLRWASASDQLAQAIEDNQEIFGQGPCMDAFAHARPAAKHDTVPNPSGGQITLVLADLRVCAGLSVPVELGGGPIATLDPVRGRAAWLG